MLDLSTAHAPSDSPDFGELRVARHEYGWIVFVQPASNAPAWLTPIHVLAVQNDCILINFDRDGPCVDGLPTYEW